MKIGFAGLGHLGSAIAQHLIAEHVDLIVWNRTPGKAAGLGVPIAKTPRELMDDSDIVIMNLFDSDAVDEVMNGKNGLLAGDCQGSLIIDTTTNHFERVLAFHEQARDHGARYLECPVLGSVVPASAGKLTVVVSGEKTAFDEAKPVLSKIGSTIHYLGEPALATKMKLINNLVLGSFMATCAEAVALGEAAGVERTRVIDILLSGAGNSMILSAKKEKLANAEFSTHFSSALIYKDLHYLQDLCRIMRRPLFIGSTVKELFAMTRSKGYDDLDFSAVYRVFKEL
ncbi:NAD(P)-dependent oxidoreductase [Methanoregula sp.]|jgi:3-hydroxyisobutyrate dehydrogenase|uniref:NAD(P)-dependent oxidoreductase n=1 Tax=Methanoregula sp. TaxID=2052170 RepID=UPI003C24A80A